MEALAPTPTVEAGHFVLIGCVFLLIASLQNAACQLGPNQTRFINVNHCEAEFPRENRTGAR